MTSALIPSNESKPIWARLNVFDLNKVRQFHGFGRIDTGDAFADLLSDVIGPYGAQIVKILADSPAKTDEGLTHICASGLTARELMLRVGSISQEDLRAKLAETILPYISSPPSEQFGKLFSLKFNVDDLDDTKGDIIVEDHASEKASSLRKINVYYAKCLLRRENNKYHINVAFYHFISVIPWHSVTALVRSREEVKKELLVASAMAYNRLHRQLKASWPDRIELIEVEDPSQVEQTS
ncbi:unnamed protein product [Rotaria sp. Silwood2]|nr:unnamed protein product [Rotaria sp. Silwood2]CAF3190252.1 unnamed protein product [Rotaria sp. Silwood2]CAF3529434.1 unnamed protein product [Rotaria sp. Silwood2]CAF3955358.1 unnamed protein product [Rotaria sp. Silwood2]CAF4640987.1 unnamed protein product [Rotaria sp. Silwood2]